MSGADSRLLVLAVPSALILAGLVWHSTRALPPRRAVTFWVSVLAYGVLRGVGVRLVTETIGASFPYEIRDPTLSLGGVAAQEVAGWAVVAYLAWWIGSRFSERAARPYVFLQVAWASLFLGAISWAVEAAAIAARWWHWTVPTASRVFLNVPAIGIVDWFFVGIDFLLPFVTLTAPSLARHRWRYLTLLLFPAHFAGHLLPGVWLHVVHWALVILASWLALRANAEDRPFTAVRAWIPTAGFALIAADVAAVNVFLVDRPDLLPSVVPAITIWLAAIRPTAAAVIALVSTAGAIWLPSLLVATAAAAGGAALLWLRKRGAALVAVTALAVFAFFFHRHTIAQRADLTARLDQAIAERDRGKADAAAAAFAAIARDHPTSYVPLALAAEIDYRRGRVDVARQKLVRAVDIKQDYVHGYRLLAVIDRQTRGNGTVWARRGLDVAPDDLQLRYLAGDDVTSAIDTPQVAAGMVALAFEAGDVEGARRLTRLALERWPDDARLRRIAARLAAGR